MAIGAEALGCYKAGLRHFRPARWRVPIRPRPPFPTLETTILLAISTDPHSLTVGVLSLGFLILSLGIHEAAHAWAAWRCGDSTAKDMGRMTLDPLRHIDPFMTILLPAILYFTSGWMFGGAKPVPVNYHRLRQPARDMMLVALAGPFSNFLLALLFMAIAKILAYGLGFGLDTVAVEVLTGTVRWNILIAVFNMLPIPPLDGSRVVNYLLPASMRDGFAVLERFGLILVFILLMTRTLDPIIWPAMDSMVLVVDTLTGGNWQ